MYEDDLCDPAQRPTSSRSCAEDAECQTGALWYASQWSPVSWSNYSSAETSRIVPLLCLQCSAHCGSGRRSRTVFCGEKTSDGNLQRLGEDQCHADARPETQEDCHEADCSAIWVAGPWEQVLWAVKNIFRFVETMCRYIRMLFQCSKACDGGQRSRTVLCVSGEGITDVSNCDVMHQLASTEACNTDVSCSDGWWRLMRMTSLMKHDVTLISNY